jgi:hypothetical protein
LTLLVEKGTFTKTTSTSTPVSQQVNLSNGSLTPKVIWLWTSGQTTSDGTYTDHMLWSYGFSDTVNDACQAMRSHETNENEAYVMRNDAIISILSLTAGSEVSRATVNSVAAGSFTLSWGVQSDTSAMVIHYMVAGGDDITNVSVFNSTSQNFSTGNHSWNGSGTSFVPDFGMVMTTPDTAAVTVNTVSSASDQSVFSLGAITGTSNQWVLIAREETITTSDNDMYLDNGNCIGSLNTTSGAVSYLGTFVSFNNSAGGGITINITNAAGNTAQNAFLLIKGGKWDVNVFQQRSGTGTQDVTLTDSTVDPALVQLVGINSATEGSVVVNHYVGIGGSDGTNEGNCWNGSTNNLGTWVTARSTSTGKVYRNATPAATASSSTTDAECDMTGMTTAGQFTLDWTTADSTQRQMAFWMLGAVPSGTTFNRSPTAEDVTVSDSSLTRVLTANRAPSSDSTTVSDASLTRMTQAFRSPSSDSVTVEDASLERSKTWPRAPTEESVTAEDSSVTRMLSASRSPSADSPTVSEEITRMLSASRSPSSDSVTTAEDVSGVKVLERAPSTDSITAEDSSVTRMLSASRAPSADTPTISEDVTRSATRVRAPTAETVTPEDVSTTQMITRVRVPNAEDVTAEDSSITRMLSATRVPTAETTTVVDSSLTRILSALRIPSSETVDIAEDVDAVTSQTFDRAPDAENITVSDASLTRLYSALRVPTTETVTPTDASLTRLLSAIRSPSTDTVTVNENIDSTVSGRVSRNASDTVDISENVSRMLQLFRVPTAETININEELTRILSASRSPSSDSTTVSDASLIRSVTRVRSSSDTPDVLEASLTRVLSAVRSVNDTTVVAEVQTNISLARRLEETVSVTEPVIERIVTAFRTLGPESVAIDEQVFFQQLHKFVFDSVPVAEQLFSERQALSGSVTYATPDEVRPLLGNIGQQRTNAQIQLAIDSAYDEINRRTGRNPPDDWKDTENDFGIVKKIARFKAALEMAVGIKDYEDRDWMQKEIEEMFLIIEQHDPGGVSSNDVVGSSADSTYALNPQGIIWSTRYPNLKKSSGTENDTTINPDT